MQILVAFVRRRQGPLLSLPCYGKLSPSDFTSEHRLPSAALVAGGGDGNPDAFALVSSLG
jgi:hypothetical protein